jgi:Domain of unknown function (DUF4189)
MNGEGSLVASPVRHGAMVVMVKFMNNKIFCILIFVSTIFFPLSVVGQTRCPVGTQTGSAQCLPDDEGSAAPPRPTGEWIKTWGALVRSNQGHGAWSSTGKLSKKEASQDALNKCYSAGFSDCIVDATYLNQCIAVAGSNEPGINFNTGKDEDVAGKRVLADCQKRSSSQCSIKFVECTNPIFRKY